MPKFRIIYLVFFLVAVTCNCRATTDEPVANKRPGSKILTLVHSLDYRPLFYVDEDSVSRGIMVDYWRLWSDRTGIEIRFEPLPWHLCLEQVKEGRSDLIPGIFYSAERDASFDFSQLYVFRQFGHL